jgi:hypothetical protein
MAQVGLPDDLSHRYYYPPGDATADPYDSVSAVLDATEPMHWGPAWGARVAAEYAVRHAGTVYLIQEDEGNEAAVDYIKSGARRVREIKRDMGTYQHHVLEALLANLVGRDDPVPEPPPHLLGAEIDGEIITRELLDAISDGLLQFIVQWDLKPEDVILTEATIANDEHGFAGTLDLGLWVRGFIPPWLSAPPSVRDGERGAYILIDCKTGRVKRRAFAQLAAYRRCPVVWLDWLGNTALTPAWDCTAVLHLDARYREGYNLVLMPQDDAAAFQRFLRLQAELHDAEREDKIRFRPIYPPLPDGTQPAPRLEHLPAGYAGIVKHLTREGLRTLGDVAAMTEAELLGVKGIGPAAVKQLEGLLAEYGLELRPYVAEPEPATAVAS